MLEIKSKKNYHSYIIGGSLLIFFGAAILALLKPSSWWVDILLFIFIEAIFLLQKVTYLFYINSSSIIIKYHHFFSLEKLELATKEIDLKLYKTGTFRSPGYFVLDVIKNRRKVYQIDSRDGFDEHELNRIKKFYDELKKDNSV